MIALVVGHSADSQNVKAVDGTTEWQFALEAAQAVAVALRERGMAALIYLRSTELGSYRERMADLTQRVNADRPDLVLSFHWNGVQPGHPHYSGALALHWPGSVRGAEMAAAVSAAAARASSIPDHGTIAQARSWASAIWDDSGRLVPAGPPLYILRDTVAPAAILEACNGLRPADSIQTLEALAAGTFAREVADALCSV